MFIINIKNPRWADESHSMIDCEAEHSAFGWIPFTASTTDTEAHGREIFERCEAGEFGPVAEYVPPPQLPVVSQELAAK